jgi:undecaprenyl-diphosphatase
MYLLSGFWQSLVAWDQRAFTVLNGKLANPFFDAVMPWLRTPIFWAPLYLFLAIFAVLNFRQRGAWWCLFFLATVALTDMTGNYGFKQVFERLRPCNDPDMEGRVRLLLDHCGAGYSFVSNHAANHMGMAVFFLITFRRIIGNWAWVGVAWALFVAYAQVYSGVHYPLDVAGGAMLGVVAGSITGWLFQDRFKLPQPAHS